MTISTDIHDSFEPDDIVRWSSDELDHSMLDQKTRDFLNEVGLPRRPGLELILEPHESSRQETKKYFEIGHIDEVDVKIGIAPNAHVIAVEPNDLMRFVNSSALAFGQFLAIFQAYRKNAQNIEEDEVLSLIERIEIEMRQLDGAAFENDENWWPLVIEQMNAGLL